MENVLITVFAVPIVLFCLRRFIPGFCWWRGCARQDQGDYDGAEQWFLRALRCEETIGRYTRERRGVALIFTSLGHLYHQQRRFPEAAEKLKAAIRIFSDLRSTQDLALCKGSLGKLYFDAGDMDAASNALKEAVADFSRLPETREAMETTLRLLDLINERGQSAAGDADGERLYTNEQYEFRFLIPHGWLEQRLVPGFAETGGQVAISHTAHRATFNVSVGPPGRPEWVAKEARAKALSRYLRGVSGRVGAIVMDSSLVVGGEPNTVAGEYDLESGGGGPLLRRRAGLISIVRPNGVEYTLQWSAMPELVSEVKRIIASFEVAE
jgi:hypothetical protein